MGIDYTSEGMPDVSTRRDKSERDGERERDVRVSEMSILRSILVKERYSDEMYEDVRGGVTWNQQTSSVHVRAARRRAAAIYTTCPCPSRRLTRSPCASEEDAVDRVVDHPLPR